MTKTFIPLLALIIYTLALSFSKAHSEELGAIWMVGDSITQSNADADSSGSPRRSLFNLLKNAGHTFTYTGHHTRNVDGLPSSGSSPATNLYHYHSGVSGIRIGEVGGNGGVASNLGDYWQTGRLDLVKPDIILIMLGTNDVGAGLGERAPERLEAMIETLYDLPGIGSPSVYIASIPPNGRSTTLANNVIKFNAFISNVVHGFQAEGRDVHYVDHFTPLNADFDTNMTPDLLHPSAVGNDIIAQNWFDAITNDVTLEANVSSNVRAYRSSASSSDLVNNGSATLESGPTYSRGPSFGPNANNDGTVDATSGTDDITFWANSSAGQTYSIGYTLDTSRSPTGYDITLLQTIHGWSLNSGNQKNQNYTVAVSKVNSREFTTLATVTYLPLSSASTSASTRVRVSNDATGVLATNVDQIRFTYTVPGSGGSQPSPAIQEIDVFGTPSVEFEIVQIRKRNAMGFVLDGGSGRSNGQNVGLFSYIDGHPNLSWEEIDRGNGFYSYQKLATNVSITGGDGGAKNQNVSLATTDAADFNQQWRKVNMGNGFYQLQKRSDLDFSINGANGGANRQNVTLWPSASSSHNLQWFIEYK